MASRSSADTIAAVATATGRGGIGVVRVSGRALAGFAERLAGKVPEPRRARLVAFLDAAGQPIDQGILLYFPAPHSFTGEDVLELQGHGGPVVMQMLLQRCRELGARLAEPGEFTRRAYLNDKLDLVQAEAVADLIEAATAQAARSALRSLAGEFSHQVQALTEGLKDLRMLVEATLDFPDEEIDPLRDTDAVPRLQGLRAALADLRARARAGSLLRTGLTVVLAGLPNVGKSSLLNRLAGAERAIVTEIPGTTRDALRETIQIEGIPLHIIDTAGLRDTDDPVEKMGIARTWQEIERADVVVQIVDARSGVTPADHAIDVKLPAGVVRIVVENKCDLAKRPAERVARSEGEQDGRRRVHIALLGEDRRGHGTAPRRTAARGRLAGPRRGHDPGPRAPPRSAGPGCAISRRGGRTTGADGTLRRGIAPRPGGAVSDYRRIHRRRLAGNDLFALLHRKITSVPK